MVCALVASAQPIAQWLESSHDFGTFREDIGKVSTTLRVVNVGDSAMYISRVQASCGCTAVDYARDAILPGDTACVRLTYNPAGRPGQFEKQVYVYANTRPRCNELTITGNVIPTDATLAKQYPIRAGSLRLTGENMVFGELVRGKGKTLYMTGYNASVDTLLVTTHATAPHLRVAVLPDTIPPGKVTALTVHYDAAKAPLWGLNVDTVTLVCSSLHQDPEASHGGVAQVSVMGQVLEDFGRLTDEQLHQAPQLRCDLVDRLDFGAMQRGERVSRQFTITNVGKSPLIVRRLWVPAGEGVVATISQEQIKRGKSAIITVTCDSHDLTNDVLNTMLIVQTNDPNQSRLELRLVGYVKKTNDPE